MGGGESKPVRQSIDIGNLNDWLEDNYEHVGFTLDKNKLKTFFGIEYGIRVYGNGLYSTRTTKQGVKKSTVHWNIFENIKSRLLNNICTIDNQKYKIIDVYWRQWGSDVNVHMWKMDVWMYFKLERI